MCYTDTFLLNLQQRSHALFFNEILLDIVVDHLLDRFHLIRDRQHATNIIDIVTGNDRVYGGFEVHVKNPADLEYLEIVKQR